MAQDAAPSYGVLLLAHCMLSACCSMRRVTCSLNYGPPQDRGSPLQQEAAEAQPDYLGEVAHTLSSRNVTLMSWIIPPAMFVALWVCRGFIAFSTTRKTYSGDASAELLVLPGCKARPGKIQSSASGSSTA